MALWLATLLACEQGETPHPSPRSDAGAEQPENQTAGRGDADVRDADTSDLAANTSADADDPKRPGFCARPDADAVRDVFCQGAPPKVESLRALEDLLHLNPLAPYTSADGSVSPLDSNAILDGVVFLGHSTALSGRLVSPINPRAVLFGRDTLLTFQRGVQQVELATRSRDDATFNFYLLRFVQACSTRPASCSPADLYTPSIESDWIDIELRDDEELKNTTSDCRQCHQRGRAQPALLMRELESPWTHFFSLDPEGPGYEPSAAGTGRDLVQDYQRAKGSERYAGLSVDAVRHTIALLLQNAVNVDQPLDFDAPTIDDELASSPVPRRSATWDRAYAAFKRGEQLALPHFESRPTDADKQAVLSAAYQKWLANELAAQALPDLSDIFSDDPRVRAELGLQNEPDATPAELLVQTCGSCHNDVLDQTISRARFSIALSRMDRGELDVAIDRLGRAHADPAAMPPLETRQLDAQARAQLVAYLRANVRSTEDDALLDRAAMLGMAGGARGPRELARIAR